MNYRRELDAIFEQVPMHELTDFMGALEAVKLAALTKTIAEIRQATSGSDPKPRPDYTIAEIARMFDKSPQTVRDWIGKGLLEAYKLFDREWRVTPENLEKFIAQQREPLKLEFVKPAPDLCAWRNVSGE